MASDNTRNDSNDSISGRSVALLMSKDPSIGRLLTRHGIQVYDFILISFLFDQGELSIGQLARIVCIEPDDLLERINRLAAAELVAHGSGSNGSGQTSTVRLTGRGHEVAESIERDL